jgi:hypothetical protein
MLVSVEELLVAIAAQSFGKGTGSPVKRHGLLIIVRRFHYVVGRLVRRSVYLNR